MPSYIKIAAVKKIIHKQSTISLVARELGVSRKTLYKWVSIYINAPRRNKKTCLDTKYVKGAAHPRACKNSCRTELIRIVKKHPTWGVTEISQYLKKGRHFVYNNLKALGLTTVNSRLAFCTLYSHVGVLDADIKLNIVKTAFTKQKKISTLAKENSVSRKTIHKWMKEYAAGGKLKTKYAQGLVHPRAYKEEQIDKILSGVIDTPALSIKDLAAKLNLGVHGVFNVLRSYSLTEKSARMSYARARTTEPQIVPVPEVREAKTFLQNLTPNLLPAPPPDGARFKISSKAIYASIFTILILVGVIGFIGSCTSAGCSVRVGNFFAAFALLMGGIFFLYSIKYYLTLGAVLSYNHDTSSFTSKKKGRGLISLILGQSSDQSPEVQKNSKSFGLESNMEDVTLRQKPFVSVQIPFYNEKNVARRAIEAAINFKYPNYEIIACDDSVDETSQIIQELQKSYLFKGEDLQITENKEEGWSMSQVEVKPGVFLKHIHRSKREGFKGKALGLALTLVNPATEFVSVFDADFVPYPDSLQLFLKYFQVAGDSGQNHFAAVQGYQWHVLNKSENWITRGVRSEYAGSYVIERSGTEIYGGLKQISGSVYMIKRRPLEEIGWGTSITEDFELTLRLYERGYKVLYTPYIQAPSECVSTIKRIIRQRMRWAEGHSFNVKKMFGRLMSSPNLTFAEKLELVYLTPYYLQAFFFLVGSLAWVIAEVVLGARLSFWTEVWGWSLVLTNMTSLPLINAAGLFQEESESKDYSGLASFIILSYILVPFQAYASVKGLFEKEEGPWFRTPKTGRVTDLFRRGRFYHWLAGVVSQGPQLSVTQSASFNFAYKEIFKRSTRRHVGNAAVALAVVAGLILNTGAQYVQFAEAAGPSLKTPSQNLSAKLTDTGNIKKTGSLDDKLSQFESWGEDSAEEKLTQAQVFSFDTPVGEVDEVFYKDPRFRIKNKSREIQFSLISMSGVNKNVKVEPTKEGNRISYKNVFGGVDLRLVAQSGNVSESIVLKQKVTLDSFEYLIKTTGVTPRETNGIIEFVDDVTGKEVYRLSPPYMYEAKSFKDQDLSLNMNDLTSSDIKYSFGITYKLSKSPLGWMLKKELTSEGKKWLASADRKFPVVIDPSVVVTGGIVDADTNYGGLQRKVAYVNGNWYAFHDDGSDVTYKKSSDGSSWGSNVDIDTGDADNYNPTIWVKGNVIWVSWVDDSSNTVEFRSIDTANSDALGTLTTCQDLGSSVGSTYLPSIAVQATGTDVFISMTDTAAGTSLDVWRVQSIGTCSGAQTIQTNSGLTAGDRPVLVTTGNNLTMIYQDGDLSYSQWSGSTNGWVVSNSTIASVTDNIYSVTSDGSTIWALSQSGTTATNFYQIGGQPDTAIVSNLTGNRLYTDIDCPASGDCKIVYTDPSTSIAYFVDCDSTSCSSPTITTLNSENTADSRRATPVAIDCSAGATDCKVILATRNLTSYSRLRFYDCENAACSTTASVQQIITLGDDIPTYLDIYCVSSTDCKFVYVKTNDNTLHFVDCDDTNCTSAARTDSSIDADIGAFGGYNSIYCPATDDCKVSYYDSTGSGIINFLDCGSATDNCASGNTTTTIDSDVGIIDTAYNRLDCKAGATECRVLYYDGTDDAVYFYDCNASATCASGSATTIDSGAGSQGSPLDLSCNTNGGSPDDCKIIYYDGADQDTTFVDCGSDTCGSPVSVDLDTTSGGDSTAMAIDCGLGVGDCQISYLDGIDQDLTYINCNDADCDTPDSTTDVDTNVSATNVIMSMDCPAVDNCKIVYDDVANQKLVFTDCNDATCSAPSFTDLDTSVGRAGIDSSIDCPASNDCKVVYWDFMSSTLKFIDCDNESCSSSTVSNLDTTSTRFAPSAVVCLTAADCKVVYYDEADADVTFLDCANGTCSSLDATTDIDTSALGGMVAMDCVAADNCKVLYSDSGSLIFLDCGTAACASATTSTPDTGIGILEPSFSIDCAGGDADCKLFWSDVAEGDVTFRDCDAADCSTGTTTDIDTDVATTVVNRLAQLDCGATDNCKLIYNDGTAATVIFVDCDNATCTAGNRTFSTLSFSATKTTSKGGIVCTDTADCKLVYADTENQRMNFVDCLSEKCAISTLTSPWTSQTNVLGVSISYDSSNTDLYAHIIKDGTEQVYFKSTDVSTISWSSETSYGFTAGDINNLSSSYSGAGQSQIGVTVRQGSNYEFAPVPENWLVLTFGTLLAIYAIRRRKEGAASIQ